MYDAWMKLWSGMVPNENMASAMADAMSQTMPSAMSQSMAPVMTPVMTPVLAGAAAFNAGMATWCGLYISAAAAPLAAFGAMTGTAKLQRTSVRTRPVAKPATKSVAKARAKSVPATRTPSAKAPAVKTAKTPVAAKKVANTAAKTPAVAAKPHIDQRPLGLDAPKGGKADDLKRIAGVGPKLESVLHDLGIYHFDQIAAWTPDQVAWVDDYLRFKGRIARDKWIDQAKVFAKEPA